jgi:hypothetical protein
MSLRRRVITPVLLATTMPLLVTVVAASPAAAWTPHVPIDTVRLPVDDMWHTDRSTLQSKVLLPPNAASQLTCAASATMTLSLRVRGKPNGYDIAFMNMTNRSTFTLDRGTLDGVIYRWLPSPNLKPHVTEKLYTYAGDVWHAGDVGTGFWVFRRPGRQIATVSI